MDKFTELREKYPVFEYNSYNISDKGDRFEVIYDFNIPGLTEFRPRWEFIKPSKMKMDDVKFKIFERTIFNLGMVEVISYLKSTCSPNLIVRAGALNKEQVEWYKKLYVNGLGEFFYINNIASQMNIDTFINIESLYNDEKETCITCKSELNGNLIPVGGGKDSVVTLETLSNESSCNMCYIINPKYASYECAKTAGYSDEQIYCPKRYLDKKIIELNEQGFLNGHTPFSAIVAFSSFAAALLLDKKYIVLSNEDSANEVNVKGTNINHQYSKSIEFENDFRAYYKKYICANGPEYFSLLRPISEWQIVRAFTKNPKYFEVFKSCNVGSKGDTWKWCENCPKCLYVYIMVYAFLDEADMKKIFDTDMLNNEKLVDIFNGLVYPDFDKPFECVGTKEEIRLSLDMIVRKYCDENKTVPLLLEQYKANFDNLEQRINNMILKWNEKNNLPIKFKSELKNYIK